MAGDTLTFRSGEIVLNMSYTANTYLIYKRFFDSDLMGDIVRIASNGKSLPKEIIEKIESGELTLDNIGKFNLTDMSNVTIDYTVMIQVIIAMIATYERSQGKRRSMDDIADSIPAIILNDADFMSQFTDFLIFGLKKKTV